MNIDDLLFTVKINPDEESHILIKDQSICKEKCEEKPCTIICPAKVYLFDKEKQETIVCYERCLEDGACYISCPFGNIEWRYPKGGTGVSYKFG